MKSEALLAFDMALIDKFQGSLHSAERDRICRSDQDNARKIFAETK